MLEENTSKLENAINSFSSTILFFFIHRCIVVEGLVSTGLPRLVFMHVYIFSTFGAMKR